MMSDEIRRMAKILKEQEDLKKLMQPAGTNLMAEYAKAIELQHKHDLSTLTGSLQSYLEAQNARRQEIIDRTLNANRLSYLAPDKLLSVTETNAVKEMVKALRAYSATWRLNATLFPGLLKPS
jgi:hypothetical protein